jgi:NAD(P)H dehydrogenase (quinone)
MSTVLITGASGGFGAAAAKAALAAAADTKTKVIVGSRSTDKLSSAVEAGAEARRVDFDDESSLTSAFAGVDRLLLVSTDTLLGEGVRVGQHAAAIKAAEAAGVKHIVYTSFVNPTATSAMAVSKDHLETEAAIAASTVPGHTFLRNSLYYEILLSSVVPAVASGTLYSATKGGKVASAARSDMAAVAAAELLSAQGGKRTLQVTGETALSYDEIARLASDVSGKAVAHQDVPLAGIVKGLEGAGLPTAIAEILSTFDAGIAGGELEATSTTIRDVTGKEPQSFRQFLVDNKAAFA